MFFYCSTQVPSRSAKKEKTWNLSSQLQNNVMSINRVLVNDNMDYSSSNSKPAEEDVLGCWEVR